MSAQDVAVWQVIVTNNALGKGRAVLTATLVEDGVASVRSVPVPQDLLDDLELWMVRLQAAS